MPILLLTVFKAECLSNEDVSKGYSFPDEDDDLSNYNGDSPHLMIPSTLLQNVFSEFPRRHLIRSMYIRSLLDYCVLMQSVNYTIIFNCIAADTTELTIASTVIRDGHALQLPTSGNGYS